MKATIIVTSFVLFAFLMGCSDNLNVSDPLNNQISGQTKNRPSVETVWEVKELSVQTASGDVVAENKASFTNPPLTMIASYEIEFDVYTDAGKFTNGYTPWVEIYRDGETVFSSSSFPNPEGDAISHIKLRFENIRFTELEMYIALFQSDAPATIAPNDENVVLKLTNIKLSREN